MKLLICFICLLCVSCTSFQNHKWNEQGLYGVWVINHAPENIDYSVIEYLPSGDKCEMSYEVTKYGLKVTLYWNKWRLENGIIKTTMYATTGSIPIGYEINDKILEMSPATLNVIINDPGEWNTEYHIKNERAQEEQVCRVVQKALEPKGQSLNTSS